MNLEYIKEFLQSHRNTITSNDVDVLVEQINSYIGVESTFKDISRVMKTIDNYNIKYLSAVQQYEVIPTNDPKLLTQRMEKAREVLCSISALHTYLVLSIATIKDSTFNMKNIKGYMVDLSEKKDHYKTEKMAWITILKSLSHEAAYVSEMRKMDIEDNIGYLKNGKKA